MRTLDLPVPLQHLLPLLQLRPHFQPRMLLELHCSQVAGHDKPPQLLASPTQPARMTGALSQQAHPTAAARAP